MKNFSLSLNEDENILAKLLKLAVALAWRLSGPRNSDSVRRLWRRE